MPGVVLQRVVEAAEKLAAGFGVIFPGIFAVENDGNDRIAALRSEWVARLA